MQIGNLSFTQRLFLAPMAGVTDLAFRQTCREHGAALTITEMVSARALTYHNQKTSQLLQVADNEHPVAVQLFGHEPACMAEAAQIACERSGCAFIDINMGCPAPKIVNNGDGAALMRNPTLAAQIITAVKQAVSVPVTVKFRKGWDQQEAKPVAFAQMAEAAGADAITVHGRTRAQQYTGQADWDAIRAVVAAVSIPVVANGDVFTPEDVPRILAHTGADFVMIGRGSLGNPWIFERANALLETGVCPPLPPFAERLATAVQQIERAAVYKGEYIALREARKHLNWYLKGQSGLKSFKPRVCALERLDELAVLVAEMQQVGMEATRSNR